MPLEDEILGESLDLIGAIGIGISVIAASIGFSHWLGARLSALGVGLRDLSRTFEKYVELQHDNTRDIKMGIMHIDDKVEEVKETQQECKERLGVIETKVHQTKVNHE